MASRIIKIRRSNFTRGMARVLDLGSTINVYICNDCPDEIDCKAIRSDWEMVGEDMRFAVSKLKKDLHGKAK